MTNLMHKSVVLLGLPGFVMHNSHRRDSLELVFCRRNENEGEQLCTVIQVEDAHLSASDPDIQGKKCYSCTVPVLVNSASQVISA